jgi:TRAP-type C4-dicarboxylate transport system permease small subunit
MNSIGKSLQRIGVWGTILGGVVLILIMLLTIASVLCRLFGSAIVGSYEITELIIIVTVGFALVYTTITESNVTVKLLIERFSGRNQNRIMIVVYLISMIFWGWMALGVLRMTVTSGWMERTEIFLVSLLPFRLVWGVALTLLSLILFMKLVEAVVREFRQ